MLLTVSSALTFPPLASVYQRFAAFHSSSFERSGQLILQGRLDPEGVAVSMAANIAGAASLCIEPESLLAKQALRTGICNFIVRDLDEAITILKSEFGKPRPVCIAVRGEPAVVVLEALERGLLPNFVYLYEDGRPIYGTQELITRGARSFPERAAHDGMVDVQWSVAREPMNWLPMTDAIAFAVLDRSVRATPQRLQWIERSAKYLGRHYGAQRFLYMTPGEADAFTTAVQHAVEGGEIQVAVSIVRNGREELLAS